MEIKNRNFYETEIVKSLIKPVHNPNYDIHKLAVPLIACVVGGTGSGKTNLLMNILEVMDKTFNKIIIFTMDRDEPLYNALSLAVPPDQLKIFEAFFFPNLQNKKNIIFSNRFENKVSPCTPTLPAYPHRKQSKTYKNHHAHNQRMT
jgi:ABC-type lipoprotein export system ATPase subunit